VDTLNPDGLQFLTFKLSFNDYYAQDISNKVKSVKNRKIEKGEFQAGIAPYGYMKDNEQKNHLIPDKNVSNIVQEIFNMYTNEGLSTIQIADILNKREIAPPCVYLKIPTFMQKDKEISEYKWLSAQISKVLRNEVYIGNIVGRKYQKVSHKVDKVRATKKDEYIIVENMHEPLIDKVTWNKAQAKLNKHTHTKHRMHNQPLKQFVYCGECGGKCTYRVRTKKRKSGEIWEYKTFICSAKNSHTKDCKCKSIQEEVIVEAVKETIRNEVEKLKYCDKELSELYINAKSRNDKKISELHRKIKAYEKKLESNRAASEEVYNDKLEGLIDIEDFNIFYKKLRKEKDEILTDIEKIRTEIIEIENGNEIIDYAEIRKIAEEALINEKPVKELYEKLIERIEFDSLKNIIVTLTFSAMDLIPVTEEAV